MAPKKDAAPAKGRRPGRSTNAEQQAAGKAPAGEAGGPHAGGGAKPAAARKRGKAAKAAAPAAAAAPVEHWDALPQAALSAVFDRLGQADLAAAASACRTWRSEAALDARWQAFWTASTSELGLWRWACADGGFREQLRAKAQVRKGDCEATVFPFDRRDGAVTEVLFYDGPQQRVVTSQSRKPSPGSMRLTGLTVKVWSADALAGQRPLLVVHDVCKLLQLEDGSVFLWRVAPGAVIYTGSSDPADVAARAAAARWAESPDLVASVLEPVTLALADVPLESTYGRGFLPYEWMDMCTGAVGCSFMDAAAQRVAIRLFDLATGRCFREAACAVAPLAEPAPAGEAEAPMMTSRNAEAGNLVVVTACLFDCRVYAWRLRDDWFAPAAREAGAAAPPEEELSAAAVEAAAAAEGDEAGPAAGAAAAPAAPAAGGLSALFTTPGLEPIVDLSVSTTARRVYVVGMENIFVLDLSTGLLLMVVRTSQWRGVAPPGMDPPPPMDVGAFSWPLPCSRRCAFYLDATNSLFLTDLGQAVVPDIVAMQEARYLAAPGRYPPLDLLTTQDGDGPVQTTYWVQPHVDLRPTRPAAALDGPGDQAMRHNKVEQVVVEYSLEGGVLFTTGETSCPAVAALLGYEKAAGTYMAGIAPKRADARGAAAVTTVRGGDGGGPRAGLARRALICMDAATGCRYKAVPLDGAVESVHSAGPVLAVALAPLETYPEGSGGALVVLDFSGRSRFAPTPRAAAKGRQAAGGAGPSAPPPKQQGRQAKKKK